MEFGRGGTGRPPETVPSSPLQQAGASPQSLISAQPRSPNGARLTDSQFAMPFQGNRVDLLTDF